MSISGPRTPSPRLVLDPFPLLQSRGPWKGILSRRKFREVRKCSDALVRVNLYDPGKMGTLSFLVSPLKVSDRHHCFVHPDLEPSPLPSILPSVLRGSRVVAERRGRTDLPQDVPRAVSSGPAKDRMGTRGIRNQTSK